MPIKIAINGFGRTPHQSKAWYGAGRPTLIYL